MDILVSDSAQDPAAEFIRARLNEYNLPFAGPDHHRPLILLAKQEGRIAGGLVGGTYWGWLYVELLWVEEASRRAGIGSRLLAEAERLALERGCRHAHLETHDFQAMEFYAERQYKLFGELDDLPPGHKKFFLKKDLL